MADDPFITIGIALGTHATDPTSLANQTRDMCGVVLD